MINFKKYDEENPQIWKEFKKIAKQAKAMGFKRYSANGIFEIMRWNTGVKGKGQYKISNNYRPDYARKMMKEFPRFADFFVIKPLKARRK